MKWRAAMMAMAAMTALWVRAAAPVEAEKEDAAALSNKVMRFVNSIHYQKGTIAIGKDLATLQVPDSFRFVGPDEAAKILLLWGNPPSDEKPLGMLFPAGVTPLSEDAWAVIIQWSADGYVKDDDAEKINYDDLMRTMKKECKEESAERVKQGYAPIELVGWATPPRYDKSTHKMYWAKEIKFGDEPANTLNYNVRILGRHGVLVLNAVAGVDNLRSIEATTPELLAMVNFNDGKRYADFDPSKDKYAAYGLAALVAGGVAAKAGLFKGLIVALIAAKKFIIIGLIALGGFLKKLLGRKRE